MTEENNQKARLKVTVQYLEERFGSLEKKFDLLLATIHDQQIELVQQYRTVDDCRRRHDLLSSDMDDHLLAKADKSEMDMRWKALGIGGTIVMSIVAVTATLLTKWPF